MSQTRYTYKNWPIVLKKMYYAQGTVALQFLHADTYEPILKATVNIPHIVLKKDEVLIKDWSENRGVLAWLQLNGIVGPTLSTHATGLVYAHKVKLLINL